ncbi:MAG TPA: hypothetical protein VHI72_19710, partial [Hyphomicrobiaceae bacterium]|nr:hypothetical protein [Hyphomicrobiaceae bacterium]
MPKCTVATAAGPWILNGLGAPGPAVGHSLGHSPGSTQGITAIYNRHRYGDEKRQALAAWSRELE